MIIFGSILTTFESSSIFGGSWGSIEDVKLGFIFDLCPSGGKALKLRDYSEQMGFLCK